MSNRRRVVVTSSSACFGIDHFVALSTLQAANASASMFATKRSHVTKMLRKTRPRRFLETRLIDAASAEMRSRAYQSSSCNHRLCVRRLLRGLSLSCLQLFLPNETFRRRIATRSVTNPGSYFIVCPLRYVRSARLAKRLESDDQKSFRHWCETVRDIFGDGPRSPVQFRGAWWRRRRGG